MCWLKGIDAMSMEIKSSGIDLRKYYPNELKILNILEKSNQITIELKSTKHKHRCPGCGKLMHAYHGTYKRNVQDLPIYQRNVMLQIAAYEYNCTNEACEITTFVEDYGGFIDKSQRMTSRLEDFLRTLAFETNCEGAAAICQKLGIKISGDTIIRLLRKLVDNEVFPSSDAIGVDDFAYRKGHKYCTVICDGATHTPIDILDGRDGSALKEWLKRNKQIKKVTRDRAGAYAKAIAAELPNAMQIADRFHLHQNLLAAIKEALRIELPNRIEVSSSSAGQGGGAEQSVGKPDKKNGFRQPVVESRRASL